MKNNKFAIFTLWAFALIGLFAGGAYANAPTNDNFASAETVSGMQVHITRSNAGATKEAGEPNHANNPGGKSVWFKWTAPMSRMMNVSTNRTPGNWDTLIHIYRGGALNNLQSEGGSDSIDSTNLKSNAAFTAIEGTTYYIAIDGRNEGQSAAEGSFLLDIAPIFRSQGADYDDDGQTNIAVYRPSTGTFFHLKNWTGETIYTLWGGLGDVPVVGGDHVGNYFSVYRPSEGMWYARPSQCCASNITTKWGLADDIPVPEAYGGSSSSDVAVFRPSNGTWYFYGTEGNERYYRFGLMGDIPVPGQYSPDAFADLAVFRPSNSTWYFLKRKSGNDVEDTFGAVQFGQSGDKPVPADYDGDGILDVAVYRPSNGTWWVLRSSNGQVTVFQWGLAEDQPVTGDFDGDGYFDYAVFRPSNHTWYIHRSGDGSALVKKFGQAGDIPVTASRASLEIVLF